MLSVLSVPPFRAPQSLVASYGFAVITVALSLGLRQVLDGLGSFYYLPMVPAVMATAIITGRRGPTLLAIVLAIVANLVQVPRESALDAATNAALFVVVCWMVGEMCWRLHAAKKRTVELSRRLARRNQILDAILTSAPVVTVDSEERVRFLTPAAADILGVEPTRAVGAPLATYVDGFSLETPSPPVWMGRRPSGPYPLHIDVGLLPEDTDGHHAALFLGDLTQAAAADDRARELHAQLNRVWRLNSLGEMAASLAHELNQPLGAATNYLHAGQAELERAGLQGQSVGRVLEQAKSQLLRAGAIIRRMRELLAHESRSLGVERVGAMVADLHGILGMIERDSLVAIEYRIDDLADQVRAERIQFQQALINLVRNAAEALAGQDDRRIRISGRPTGDDRYEVMVEDNGAGVAPETLETIFRPLMTTKSAGMGLGLSVTRTIVESHGGALAVGRSDLGGAAFAFSLPRERELEDA